MRKAFQWQGDRHKETAISLFVDEGEKLRMSNVISSRRRKERQTCTEDRRNEWKLFREKRGTAYSRVAEEGVLLSIQERR